MNVNICSLLAADSGECIATSEIHKQHKRIGSSDSSENLFFRLKFYQAKFE